MWHKGNVVAEPEGYEYNQKGEFATLGISPREISVKRFEKWVKYEMCFHRKIEENTLLLKVDN